jgi:hypothetical protein
VYSEAQTDGYRDAQIHFGRQVCRASRYCVSITACQYRKNNVAVLTATSWQRHVSLDRTVTQHGLLFFVCGLPRVVKEIPGAAGELSPKSDRMDTERRKTFTCFLTSDIAELLSEVNLTCITLRTFTVSSSCDIIIIIIIIIIISLKFFSSFSQCSNPSTNVVLTTHYG